jgi:1,4-dihydroxy-2-naphthoate octaprenyltransferase
MGTAMAHHHGVFSVIWFALTLLAALSIQIGTNYCNDYFDFKKGADTHERLGPTRATQAGLVRPAQMRVAYQLAFAISALLGLALVWRGGLPILVIGLLSIASGIMYTAGKYALGYLGLSELFVLIFFGPVAVAGTYYLQTLHLNIGTVVAGLSPGLWSVAILCVNNLRDRQQDIKANKKTLAVRLGKEFAQYEYIACIALALLIPVILWMGNGLPSTILWTLGVSVIAVPTARIVMTYHDPRDLNDVLAQTGKMLMLFSVIFALSLM